ncbi:amine oxidase [Ancylostoma ceylanicum]|uniref:Amine oxidase n=1 Tax=Ancylostoma ceylanicum TaxID=53326 RepID=A0A0D6LUW4_9BILA|nr:amine oxidase [Ancylostoma ceylanicum]
MKAITNDDDNKRQCKLLCSSEIKKNQSFEACKRGILAKLKQIFDVVIVGAGLTGLTAARELKKKAPDARIKLLEARDEANGIQVGGRIRAKTMKTSEGEVLVDTGSHFISPSATALSALASELGLTAYTQSNCGTRTLNIRGFRTKRQSPFLSSPHSFNEVLQSPDLSALASQNVHSYFTAKQTTRAETDTANRLLQTLFDSPDVAASILHLMLASGSENTTMADMLSRYGHGQALLLHGGLYKLTRALAEKLDIGLNETVTAIEEGESQVTVKTNSGSYTARQVIVTVPPVLTSSIEFQPELDTEFANFTKKYAPAGRAYYFTMTYASPFWRPLGRNGQIIYTNAQGPIVWLTTFDVGKLTMCAGSGSTGVLWGIAHFLEGAATSQAQRNAAYVDIVTKSLSLGTHLPLDITDVHYSADPFTRGTIAVLPPGVDVAGLQYLQGVNTHGKRIVFASAEYSNSSMGLMNGAVLSGKLAATVVAPKLLSAVDSTREDNEIANMVRLSDDAASEVSQRPLISAQPQFIYRTSTHYPPTTTIELTTYKHFSFGNTNEAPSEDSKLATLGDSDWLRKDKDPFPSKFLAKYAATVLSIPEAPFVIPPHNSSISTIPPPTTTERSTFTPVNPNRSTTPFDYRTSTLYSPMPTIETSTFKHFSNGNQEEDYKQA